MKIVRPKVHPFLAEFKKLPPPRTGPHITNLRGNIRAPLLLLCEHPTLLELEENVPFADMPSRIMSSLLNQAGFECEEHFLIMPHSRFGPKPSKASTCDTLPMLQRHLPDYVKGVVCLGMPAFGFTFAGGRKTHAQTIIGNPMYIPRLRTLPVFVLPGSELLLETSSDDYRLRNKAMEKAEQFLNLSLNLFKFCQTKLGLFR